MTDEPGDGLRRLWLLARELWYRAYKICSTCEGTGQVQFAMNEKDVAMFVALGGVLDTKQCPDCRPERGALSFVEEGGELEIAGEPSDRAWLGFEDSHSRL